ncbi:MAG: hypothetical protein WCT29_01505 [Candidatus Paceibacterota bacterium]|jgi:hypothetical protein
MNSKTESKICADCKEEFIIDSGDLLLYEKVGLKIPEQCFGCRVKQHFAFSVFGKFRKGVSALRRLFSDNPILVDNMPFRFFHNKNSDVDNSL